MQFKYGKATNKTIYLHQIAISEYVQGQLEATLKNQTKVTEVQRSE